MEELIKAAEAVMRLRENLIEANEEQNAAQQKAFRYTTRMFGNDIPDTFVYTSDAGDSYLITVDIEGGHQYVLPVPVLHQRDAAIRDYHTMAHQAEAK